MAFKSVKDVHSFVKFFQGTFIKAHQILTMFDTIIHFISSRFCVKLVIDGMNQTLFYFIVKLNLEMWTSGENKFFS